MKPPRLPPLFRLTVSTSLKHSIVMPFPIASSSGFSRLFCTSPTLPSYLIFGLVLPAAVSHLMPCSSTCILLCALSATPWRAYEMLPQQLCRSFSCALLVLPSSTITATNLPILTCFLFKSQVVCYELLAYLKGRILFRNYGTCLLSTQSKYLRSIQ